VPQHPAPGFEEAETDVPREEDTKTIFVPQDQTGTPPAPPQPSQQAAAKFHTVFNFLWKEEAAMEFMEIAQQSSVTSEEVVKHNATFPALESSTKKTLLLDLDETLIHVLRPENSYRDGMLDPRATHEFVYLDENTQQLVTRRVVVRPHALTMLKEMLELFEVGIFTASTASYAKSLLSLLDPSGKLKKRLLYRKHCIQRGNRFVKDLRVLQNRALKDLVILDNSIFAFSSQLDNGIYVPSFSGAKTDSALACVLPLLRRLATCQDIRHELSGILGLSALHTQFLKELRA
jgi:Dullard-like phosphatase family protein